MLIHDENYEYEIRPTRGGSYTFHRRKLGLTGRPRKVTKTVTIPAPIMENEHPEDVLLDIIDEGGFDY